MSIQAAEFRARYGPWALVAGASEGLGESFAQELARRGLSVVLLARREEQLSQVAQRIEATHGVETRIFPMDLSQTEAIQNLERELASVDLGLLIYNAACSCMGSFVEQELDDLLRVLDVNVRGPLVLLRCLAPRLVERGRGGIVLMSSLAGFQGSPKIATYAASKAFNTILAEGLWGELREQGVDVLASCAGAIRTPNYLRSSAQTKEAPGILDPSVVAARTLDALGRGPRTIPGLVNQMAQVLLARLLPRATAIQIMKKNTEELR